MRLIAIVAVALAPSVWATSCVCRSFQQGFQQGVQQAQGVQESTPASQQSGKPTGGGGASNSERPVRLVDVTVGDTIDVDTNEITRETAIFWPSDPTMHISALLVDGREGTVVKAELIGVALDLGESGLVTDRSLSELELAATGEEELPVYFDFHAPDGGWPLGEYACDLYVDGELVDSIETQVVLEESSE